MDFPISDYSDEPGPLFWPWPLRNGSRGTAAGRAGVWDCEIGDGEAVQGAPETKTVAETQGYYHGISMLFVPKTMIFTQLCQFYHW